MSTSSFIATATMTINKPFFVAGFFAYTLYGICMFSYIMQAFPSQATSSLPLTIKAILTVQMILLTLVTVVFFVSEYIRIVNHFGELGKSLEIPLFFKVSLIPDLLISLICQSYYLKIILHLIRRKPLKYTFGTLVILAMVGQAGVSIWNSYVVETLTSFVVHDGGAQSVRYALRALAGVAMGIDLTLALTMVILLYRLQTGFERTDTFLRQLILFFRSSGVLAAIFSLLTLILVSIESTWAFLPYNIFPYLKYICLASIINHRESWSRTGLTQKDTTSFLPVGSMQQTYSKNEGYHESQNTLQPTETYKSSKTPALREKIKIHVSEDEYVT